MLAFVLLGCVVPYRSDDPADAVRIGAVLPFTGEQAAIGPNIERMLSIAEDAVNTAGGIRGRRLVIEVGDTHSEVERGRRSALDLLRGRPLVGWLGPEEADLALDLAPDLEDLVWLLPGAASPSPRAFGGDPFHVRIGPSAAVVAGALAARIRDDLPELRELAVIDAGDSYTAAFASLLGCEFLASGGASVTSISALDDLEALVDLMVAEPDAVAVLAYPRSGAELVSDWTSLARGDTRWYLPPTLDTDEFVRNVPPGALDDAVGIEPQVEWTAAVLSGAFEEAWGDFPIRTAYYYYDAVAVLALAISRAGDDATADQILAALAEISVPPGEAVGWDDLAKGLTLAEQGQDIDYVGLTGEVDIVDGTVSQSLLGFWEVVDDQILHSALPEDFGRFETSACAVEHWQ